MIMKRNFKDSKKAGIYSIKNMLNNKQYIGKSIDIHRRIYGHIKGLNSKSKDENRHLINSWQKYGKDSFEYSVLEYVEESDKVKLDKKLKELEEYYIIKEKSYIRKFGYNLNIDSSTSLIVSDETKKIMSENMKKRNKKYPEISKNIGKKVSDFWNAPINIDFKKRQIELFKKRNIDFHSLPNDSDRKVQWKSKLSKSKRKFTIVQLTTDLNIIKEFDTIQDVLIQYPTYNYKSILCVCGGTDNSYKGCVWRYRDIVSNQIRHYDYKIPKKDTSVKIIYQVSKFENLILNTFTSNKEVADFMNVKEDTVSKWLHRTFPTKKYDFYFTVIPPNRSVDIELETKQISLLQEKLF